MTFGAGGTMVLSYSNGSDTWDLRLPVAPFDPTTFAYTGTGPKVPSEAGIAATFTAFGAVWAPYFDPTWALSLEALFHSDGTVSTKLPAVPTVGTINGDSPTPSSSQPPIMRGFTFVVMPERKQIVRLFSVATDRMGGANVVTANSGGFDARDQVLVAYLSGPATGLVLYSGIPYPNSAKVYQRYKLRPFEPAAPVPPPGAALPPGTTGDILVNIGGSYVALPPGSFSQQLVITELGSALMPQWIDSCCATTTKAVPGVPTTKTGAGVTEGLQRCGAAVAMADFLERYYGNVKTFLNMAAVTAAVLSISTIVSALVDAAVGAGLTWAGLLNQTWLKAAATWLLGGALASFFFDTLSTDENQTILKSIYCALGSDTGALAITTDTIETWAEAIEADPTLSHNDTGTLLGFLSRIISPAQWQSLANGGVLEPTGICSAFSCGVGKAMRGRAVFGAGLNRAMQGHAVFGVVLNHSMSGHATYGVNLSHSMRGHAHS